MHLRALTIQATDTERCQFPFTIPSIAPLHEMTLNQSVTLFVGENGTGKSTLLESVAVAAQSITVGMESVQTDAHMEPAKSLADALKLVWNKRTRTGFFFAG